MRSPACAVGGKDASKKFVSPESRAGERNSAVLGALLAACCTSRTKSQSPLVILSLKCNRQPAGHPRQHCSFLRHATLERRTFCWRLSLPRRKQENACRWRCFI